MRVAALLALPFETMDQAELVRELTRIGQTEGAA
jgi:arsenate reductase (thioredoxin)